MTAPADVRPQPTTDLEGLRRALDEIGKRESARVGKEDLDHIRRVDRFARAMEAVGRTLIHVSLDPATFSAGVTCLWIHKQLHGTELGHSILHGMYDNVAGAERYHSMRWRWRSPVDERAWQYVHNMRHHPYTNIAGRDPDIHFGPLRLNARTPWKSFHRKNEALVWRLALSFMPGIAVEYSGVSDYYYDSGQPARMDLIPDRSAKTKGVVYRVMLRKMVPYFARELLLYPALAGPMFPKVVLGNMISDVWRNLWSAAAIFCGHVGEEIADFPAGTKAANRGDWYKMQVESTQNIEAPFPFNILWGGLDVHIEHHLYPKIPPSRLRKIAPEVRRVCERYGVHYKSETWPKTFRTVMRRFRDLARPDPVRADASEVPSVRVANPRTDLYGAKS